VVGRGRGRIVSLLVLHGGRDVYKKLDQVLKKHTGSTSNGQGPDGRVAIKKVCLGCGHAQRIAAC
jgi:hypothetical protein